MEEKNMIKKLLKVVILLDKEETTSQTELSRISLKNDTSNAEVTIYAGYILGNNVYKWK